MTAERELIIQEIRSLMKASGHNNAPGCPCCATVRMIIDALSHGIDGKVRIVEGVRITGPVSVD